MPDRSRKINVRFTFFLFFYLRLFFCTAITSWVKTHLDASWNGLTNLKCGGGTFTKYQFGLGSSFCVKNIERAPLLVCSRAHGDWTTYHLHLPRWICNAFYLFAFIACAWTSRNEHELRQIMQQHWSLSFSNVFRRVHLPHAYACSLVRPHSCVYNLKPITALKNNHAEPIQRKRPTDDLFLVMHFTSHVRLKIELQKKTMFVFLKIWLTWIFCI